MASMRPSVAEAARHKWPGILRALGFAEGVLSGRAQPCPACGGVDRFRFDDKDGRGSFYCNGCGPGDGFSLLQRVKGWAFAEAAKAVEEHTHLAPPAPARAVADSPEAVRAKLAALWRETAPIRADDAAGRYLAQRLQLLAPPPTLRYHPGLFHAESRGRYPGLVAQLVSPADRPVCLHRTFLTPEGAKAPVSPVRKLSASLGLKGAAIRLAPRGPVLGIAEGIETALAAMARFQVPVWAAVSANGLATWDVPAGVERVCIFADHDVSGVGQLAAFTLMQRLWREGVAAEVQIAPTRGSDWADHP